MEIVGGKRTGAISQTDRSPSHRPRAQVLPNAMHDSAITVLLLASACFHLGQVT